MKVFIDGPDGAGKTTVCEKLANKIGCNIVRLTYNGDRSYNAYFDAMSLENMVHDRTFLSEVIYPKYFGRESRVSDSTVRALFNLTKILHAKVFILTADDDVLLERVGKRGDEFIEDLNIIKNVNKDYLRVAQEHDYKVIDTTNKTFDEIVEEIIHEL